MRIDFVKAEEDWTGCTLCSVEVYVDGIRSAMMHPVANSVLWYWEGAGVSTIMEPKRFRKCKKQVQNFFSIKPFFL